MILCLTGMPGSGKSTVAEILAARGFEVFELSAIIKDEMKRHKLEINNESLEAFANKTKAEHGKDVFAVMMGEKIKKQDSDNDILVVGFRSTAEFEAVEKTVGKELPLIVILTPQKLRFERLHHRDYLPIKDMDSLLMRDQSNIRMGINELLGSADYAISNEGTKKELEDSINELIAKIEDLE